MSRLIFAAAIVGVVISGSGAVALAAPQHATMTCRDFLSLDAVTRPKIVYWAEGVGQKAKPEDAVVDVESVDRLIPVIVEQCRASPQTSFWAKMEADWRTIKADVKRHL